MRPVDSEKPPMPPESRPRTADPMAELKQRARFRLLGALLFLGAASALAFALLRDRPRPLAHEFVLRMPGESATAAPEASLGSAAAVVPGLGEPPSLSTPDTPNIPNSPGTSGSEPLANAVPPSVSDAKPEARPEAKTEARPEAKPEPKTWLVQVGAYGSEKTARSVAKKVAGAGPTDVSEVKTGSGSRWRVRVGPMGRSDAEAFRDKARAQRYDAILVKVDR